MTHTAPDAPTDPRKADSHTQPPQGSLDNVGLHDRNRVMKADVTQSPEFTNSIPAGKSPQCTQPRRTGESRGEPGPHPR